MPGINEYSTEDFLADESFVNYLLGNNEADVQLWKERIAGGQLNHAALTQASELFLLLKSDFKAVNKPAEFAKLQQLMLQAKEENTPVLKSIPAKAFNSKYNLRFMWRAAAAVIILFIAAWFYFKSVTPKITPIQDFIAFANAKETMQRISLPDGSEVILNSNSSVSIAPDFNKEKREILLTGTAFFEVAKNPAKPFTVISGNVNTTALGTSFYIHQSSNAAPTTVSLLTGKVRIDAKGQSSINLVPYEKVTYKDGTQLTKSVFDNDALTNWTKGIVTFKKANWEQVKNIIEEYFDKKLILNNAAKDISFTGEFKANEFESILSSLEFTYDLKYTIQNNTVTIAF